MDTRVRPSGHRHNANQGDQVFGRGKSKCGLEEEVGMQTTVAHSTQSLELGKLPNRSQTLDTMPSPRCCAKLRARQLELFLPQSQEPHRS